MTFTNLSQIIACINKWQAVITDANETIDYLNCGDSFVFTRTQGICSNLHVYPGAFEDENGKKKLYMFLISEDDDKSDKDEIELFNAITQSEVTHNGLLSTSPDQIPEAEALERIRLWNENFEEWVDEQITTTDGIFKAFNMPCSEVVDNRNYTTFFALKENTNSSETADLITRDLSTKQPSFYDTVRPVPPFDATYPLSAFYLLSK